VFSDSIICSIPLSINSSHNNHYAYILITSIASTIQQHLLNYKFISRGYISTGEIFHKNNTVFGKALAIAVKEESKIGDSPIIVIAPEIINYKKSIKNLMNAYRNHFKTDYFGRAYVHYLKQNDKWSINDNRRANTLAKKNIKKFQKHSNIFNKWKFLEQYSETEISQNN
jgi:hypothetical protein